jgi:hypothetical protein
MSVYANADMAETRMRRALKYQLEQVTESNGYQNTIREVHEEVLNLSAVLNFPAVIMQSLREVVLNQDQSDGLWHNEVEMDLICILRDGADPVLARESLKADILHRLGNFWTLPNEAGAATAMMVRYNGSVPFGIKINSPKVGVAINIRVQYRQVITDPSVAG